MQEITQKMHISIMAVSEEARQEKESRGHLKEQWQKSAQTWSEQTGSKFTVLGGGIPLLRKTPTRLPPQMKGRKRLPQSNKLCGHSALLDPLYKLWKSKVCSLSWKEVNKHHGSLWKHKTHCKVKMKCGSQCSDTVSEASHQS